ncbi:MAG: carbohydrate kinase [Actinomycetia bacterium]|nr:carbohydrate kinase [Actinomycetes bacterium]
MRFAGVDIGTSGLKLAVVDDTGRVVDERSVAYPTTAPRPGWCEIDPAEWLGAYRTAAADLGAVDAIGFAGQMHGVVLTDAGGAPLRPAILWPDRRAASIAAEWERTGVLDALDTPIKPGYAGAILAWLRAHEPEIVARTARVWFAKDWVRARLTGEPGSVTERSDAAGSLLWDPRTQAWSPEAADLVGVPLGVLGGLCESAAVAGTIGGVPAVVGGADTAVALDAYRALEPRSGTVYVNAGSGCQIVRPYDVRPPRSLDAECVFADTSDSWYAMRALDVRGVADGAALARVVADAVEAFDPEQVVVGGGAVCDPRFRRELGRLLNVPARSVGLRSLSACGAALLASTSMGRRIGLRHDSVDESR